MFETAMFETAMFETAALQFLPVEERTKISPHLTPVTLKPHRVLHETGRPVEQVYFLPSGLVSLCAVGEDGHSVETAGIGPGGMVGSTVLLG